MDKLEIRIIVVTGLLLASFLFSVLWALDKRHIDVPACIPYDSKYATSKITQLDSNTYQVYVVARMWQFDPPEIDVPVGSTVDFYLTSKDVTHGFNIADKSVNMMAVYGGITETTVHFDKPGTYSILCHEYCGAGHQSMTGKVVVSPKKQK